MDNSVQEANRLRRLDAKQHLTLTHMHLSWLLDLAGASFERVTEEQANSASFNLRSWFQKNKKDSVPCALSQEKFKQIMDLIAVLNKDENLCQEGLFRKSGGLGRQKRLQSESGSHLNDDLEELTAHDTASILKQQLAALPEPLLQRKNYEALLQVPDLASARQLKCLQLVLQLVPPLHARLTCALARLLHAVTLHQSSRMSPRALGALFAPHVLCPKKLKAELLKERKDKHEAVVASLICHAQELHLVPREYACDVQRALSQMHEGALEVSRISSASAPPSISGGPPQASSAQLKRKSTDHDDDREEAVQTTFSFVNREATAKARKTTDTQMALCQLHSHIQSLPDSARKNYLLRQFRQLDATGSPRLPSAGAARRRSKSISRQVKRQVSRLTSSVAKKNTKTADRSRASFSPPSARTMLSALVKSPPPTPAVSALLGSDRTVPLTPLTNVTSTPGPTVSDVWRRSSTKPGCGSPILLASRAAALRRVVPVRRSRSTSHKARSAERVSPGLKTCSARVASPLTDITARANSACPEWSQASPKSTSIQRSITSDQNENSPITPILNSVRKAPKQIKDRVMTPRSRQAITLCFSPETAC